MKPAEIPNLPAGVADQLAGEGIEELYPAPTGGRRQRRHRRRKPRCRRADRQREDADRRTRHAVGRQSRRHRPLHRPIARPRQREESGVRTLGGAGFSVGVSTGNYEASGEWLASRDIIVATSEKVDSLIRNNAPWIDDLSCVVADEVHLVDDRNRGPTLEVTLAKLRRINPDLQTVALSATVGNAGEIADWLDAELVSSDWRPIDLRTGVHYGSAINFDDGSQREVPVAAVNDRPKPSSTTR